MNFARKSALRGTLWIVLFIPCVVALWGILRLDHAPDQRPSSSTNRQTPKGRRLNSRRSLHAVEQHQATSRHSFSKEHPYAGQSFAPGKRFIRRPHDARRVATSTIPFVQRRHVRAFAPPQGSSTSSAKADHSTDRSAVRLAILKRRYRLLTTSLQSPSGKSPRQPSQAMRKKMLSEERKQLRAVISQLEHE